ncbi:hypothetical protein CHAB381_0903 [Campylobacter hominis ATCC BAA-381]|uniref:Uncharacterized protein n=1 Tax=Campylobacter hominis (strain ATCC BAA-381 / DSM 21671 / CCUG 45161 / LMG 19568 / NCTC 13146 / CH001A) TaxID=360107 RepID=A7I1S4_CAMHC|nr:hypothetical protein CHAB381_0903 [Campylobacter hominis ATCC BAA-381]
MVVHCLIYTNSQNEMRDCVFLQVSRMQLNFAPNSTFIFIFKTKILKNH